MPIRGGNWGNGADAGLAALNLNNPRSNSNANIGFRVAFAPSYSLLPKPVSYGLQEGATS